VTQAPGDPDTTDTSILNQVGFSTHGNWVSSKEIHEIEDERGNIVDDVLLLDGYVALWVTKDPQDAARYNRSIEDYDSVATQEELDALANVDLEGATRVESMDDGDGGELWIRKIIKQPQQPTEAEAVTATRKATALDKQKNQVDTPQNSYEFEHRGKVDITETDPAKHGTGIKGSELDIKKAYPDLWIDRTYLTGKGNKVETDLKGKIEYTGVIRGKVLRRDDKKAMKEINKYSKRFLPFGKYGLLDKDAKEQAFIKAAGELGYDIIETEGGNAIALTHIPILGSENTTMNVGMDVKNVPDVLNPEQIVKAIEANSTSKVLSWEVKKSKTENTVIPELDKPATAQELRAISDALDQDAVSQYSADGVGVLAGRMAITWGGEFDPAEFLLRGTNGRLFSEVRETDTQPDTVLHQSSEDIQATAAPVFYSALQKVVSAGIANKGMPAKANSLINWLAKQGVKPVELKEMGVEQWLKNNQDANGKIDKEAFQSYLVENAIVLDESQVFDDRFDYVLGDLDYQGIEAAGNDPLTEAETN